MDKRAQSAIAEIEKDGPNAAQVIEILRRHFAAPDPLAEELRKEVANWKDEKDITYRATILFYLARHAYRTKGTDDA